MKLRLLDKIRRNYFVKGFLSNEEEQGKVAIDIWNRIGSCIDYELPVIDITNVYFYFRTIATDGYLVVDEKHLHFVKPPFRTFWFETIAPPKANTLALVELFSAGEFFSLVDDDNFSLKQLEIDFPATKEVLFTTNLFIDEEIEMIFPSSSSTCGMDKDGHKLFSTHIDYTGNEDVANSLITEQLFALNLMNCRNVKLVDNDPIKQAKTNAQKRLARKLVRFKTIEIKSMKRVPKERVTGIGEKRHDPLHIVRGHFKTFTKERPLFGRHVGTYWWDQTIKGDVDKGLIMHDYKMEEVAHGTN